MKKGLVIIVAILSLFSIDSSSQRRIPIGMEVGLGGGYNFYDSKTNNYFDHSPSFSFRVNMFIGNFFIELGGSQPLSKIKRSIVIGDSSFTSNDELQLNFGTCIVGYKFYLNKKILSVDPYIGFLRTHIDRYDARTAYCGGFYLTRHFKTMFWDLQPSVFFNNRINYTKLNEMNYNLGNLYYSCEIGLAISWDEW